MAAFVVFDGYQDFMRDVKAALEAKVDKS